MSEVDSPDDSDDEELTSLTGHEIGVSALTQDGARVTLEPLLNDPPVE